MSKSHKRQEASDDDDWWTWTVIGLIFCGVVIAFWAPVVWQSAHSG